MHPYPSLMLHHCCCPFFCHHHCHHPYYHCHYWCNYHQIEEMSSSWTYLGGHLWYMWNCKNQDVLHYLLVYKGSRICCWPVTQAKQNGSQLINSNPYNQHTCNCIWLMRACFCVTLCVWVGSLVNNPSKRVLLSHFQPHPILSSWMKYV